MSGLLVPAVITRNFCNIFGDDINGAQRLLGGLGDASTVDKQWYCDNQAIGRYRAECEHNHRGQVMKLCGKHWRMFRSSIRFCPRCNADENNGHQCRLTIHPVT